LFDKKIRYFYILFSTLIIVAIFFIYNQYNTQKTLLYKDIDSKLKEMAFSTAYLLGDELNTDPFNKNISKEQNKANAFFLANLTDESEIKYVYTMVSKDGKVYFTTSSITKEEKKTHGWLPYLLPYEDATDKLKEAFKNHKTYYGEATDKYGTFRSIIMPRQAKDGTWYIVGADIEVSYVDKILNNMLVDYVILFTVFLVILLPFIKIFNNMIKKEKEELLSSQKAMLEQLKLAQMGSMIGNIAHQWRQPLSQINSIVMRLENDYNQKKLKSIDLEKYISDIENITEYMSNTISDFNNFFKQDKQKDIFSINEFLEQVLDIFKPTIIKYNIDVQLILDKEYTITTYKGELIQVLLVIFQNAKDIFLEKNIKNPKIIIKTISDKQYLHIVVEDNAQGVKEENIDKIFEPYFTTKFKAQGTGIGLYMAKIIIEQNIKGKLSVSNSDCGAVFTISLPVGG